MSEIKQVSLFVENRPGRTAKVAKTLSDAGVNIRALTIAEAGDFGVIRMVLDDAEKGYKVLKENAYAFVTAKAQRAMLILRVDDITKARKVLSDKNIKIATKEEIQAI